jgi:type VI secretion system protein VasD
MFKSIKLIISSIFIFVSLVGCSSKPTHLELVLKTSKELNPDINEMPSPLMVTFYELESAEKFIKYDYWTLLSKSGENLKDDLVSQAKHIILPEQEQKYKIVFSENTKFLGVICNFRNIDSKYTWKYVVNLQKDTYNYDVLKIEKSNIERIK